MKKHLIISICLFTLCGLSAQVQQGVVKTKGRLNPDGSVTAGVPLSGAFVTVRDAQTVTSNKKGQFSVSLKTRDFYLKEVSKEGYALCDADALSRPYAYSNSPLYIVMETPSQQLEDKLMAERRLRRTLQEQLQRREEEIDSLKASQQITDEEYRQALQQIYSEQEENERLISDMSERYAKIDYDQLDEFNQRISNCIIEGRLTEADSLIRAKGNMQTRVSAFFNLQERNKNEEQQIKQRLKKLEKSKAYEQQELADLAQDCYSLFEIFKMQHQNDSAAYYLELRASLDTTNVQWMIETADFLTKYLARYDVAEDYYQKIRRAAIQDGDSILIAKSYLLLGQYQNTIQDFQMSLLCLDSAEQYIKKSLGEQIREAALIYHQKGVAYDNLQQFKTANEYYERSLSIFNDINEGHSVELAGLYVNMGGLSIHVAQYEKAIEYFNKANDIFKDLGKGYELEQAMLLNNIGVVYGKMGLREKSFECHRSALSIRENVVGKKHPMVAGSLHNIGSEYSAIQNYDSALVYYKRAADIYSSTLGAANLETLKSLSSVGATYVFMDQDSIGEEILLECLDLYNKITEESRAEKATIYTNLVSLCIKRKDYERAKEYLSIEEQIYKDIYGVNHPNYAISLAGFADIFDEIGEHQLALQYYEQAYSLLKLFLPENHPAVQLMKSQIDIQKERIKKSK